MSIPFRWNLKRREQLGTWLDQLPEVPRLQESELATLRTASADLLGTTMGANLGFVGRTPENFFDYLSGIFDELEGAPSLHLIQFSMRWPGPGGVKAIAPHAFTGLTDYFHHEGVHPDRIANTQAPLALVDFVASGGTMETLCKVLHRMAQEAGTDWNSVQRRLMLVGLLPEKKTSPNTWRWQQHQDWLDLIPDAAIRNISVPAGFVFDLANYQNKTTPSFTMRRWSGEQDTRSRPNEAQLLGLARAARLYECGKTNQERANLARELARHVNMKSGSVRRLVGLLRRK